MALNDLLFQPAADGTPLFKSARHLGQEVCRMTGGGRPESVARRINAAISHPDSISPDLRTAIFEAVRGRVRDLSVEQQDLVLAQLQLMLPIVPRGSEPRRRGRPPVLSATRSGMLFTAELCKKLLTACMRAEECLFLGLTPSQLKSQQVACLRQILLSRLGVKKQQAVISDPVLGEYPDSRTSIGKQRYVVVFRDIAQAETFFGDLVAEGPPDRSFEQTIQRLNELDEKLLKVYVAPALAIVPLVILDPDSYASSAYTVAPDEGEQSVTDLSISELPRSWIANWRRDTHIEFTAAASAADMDKEREKLLILPDATVPVVTRVRFAGTKYARLANPETR